MSQTSIGELEIEENEEEIEMRRMRNSSNIVPSILTSDEVIVNVVIKDLNHNIFLKKVIVRLEDNFKSHNVLCESLKLLNKMFDLERSPMSFKVSDLSLFCLKPSKKNGLPDYDLPSKNNI